MSESVTWYFQVYKNKINLLENFSLSLVFLRDVNYFRQATFKVEKSENIFDFLTLTTKSLPMGIIRRMQITY